MGVLDFLKKLFPPGENPMLGMEPQCVRFRWLTLRLPPGWRFTEADGMNFKAAGPGDCAVDGFLAGVHGSGKAGDLVRLMSEHFFRKGSAPAETVLAHGVVWLEAVEGRGKEKTLRLALIKPKPGEGGRLPPVLQVTCTLPGTSAAEALRAALRSAQWN